LFLVQRGKDTTNILFPNHFHISIFLLYICPYIQTKQLITSKTLIIMAKELKGSKTEQNLWEAFAGESKARNKYTYYASKAKKDGFEQMAQLFQETADQEKEHAKMWFKLIHGIGTTADNLKDAAQGEYDEWTDMYPRMAREAREEGFEEIAQLFEGVAAIEKVHEEKYKKLLENIEQGIVFSRDGDTVWQCRNCGHIHIGKQAPETCPVCNHPQAYFELKKDNY